MPGKHTYRSRAAERERGLQIGPQEEEGEGGRERRREVDENVRARLVRAGFAKMKVGATACRSKSGLIKTP